MTHDADQAPRAGPYVVKKLRELDHALALAVPRVLQSSDDEAIHDLRVAIRKLRTMLKMARPLYGRWHCDVVRKAFAEVMSATGDLRDEEVLEETLADVSTSPSFTTWLGARAARERKLRRNVTLRIERGELDRARLLLKALLVFPLEPKRDVELARFSRRTVERARRAVEKGRDVPVSDVVGLHDLRIAYKELRYSIELLAEALPLDARAMLEPATVFQKRLGEIHDVDVALDTVQKARNLPAVAREEALAELAAKRDRKIAKYLKELDPIGAATRAKIAADADAASGAVGGPEAVAEAVAGGTSGPAAEGDAETISVGLEPFPGDPPVHGTAG